MFKDKHSIKQHSPHLNMTTSSSMEKQEGRLVTYIIPVAHHLLQGPENTVKEGMERRGAKE